MFHFDKKLRLPGIPAAILGLACLTGAFIVLAIASQLTTFGGLEHSGLRGTIDVANEGVATRIGTAQTAGFVQQVSLKSALLVVHVFGLSLGLGGAVFMDGWMLRHVQHKPISATTLELMRYAGVIVLVGLALLWISGLVFLFTYYQFTPEKLGNPKIWAKVLVVVLLTMNGLVIHKHLMDFVAKRRGQTLFGGMDLAQKLPVFFVAATSVSGWLFAFLLGMFKELNNVVPASTLLAGFGGVLLLAFSIITIFDSAAWWHASARSGSGKIPAARQ